MKLTIDRNVWLRGTSWGQLLNGKGKRCCVGIYLSVLGMSDEQLRPYCGAGLLNAEFPLPTAAKWLLAADNESPSSVAGDLYQANDDSARSEEQREDDVALGFAKVGVEVEFIN